MNYTIQELINYVTGYILPFKDSLLRQLISKLESLISIEELKNNDNTAEDENISKVKKIDYNTFGRGYYYSMLELIRGSEYWYIRPDIVTSTTPVVPDVTTSSLVSDVVTQVVEGSLETLSDSGSITPTNITRVTTPPIDEYETYFK